MSSATLLALLTLIAVPAACRAPRAGDAEPLRDPALGPVTLPAEGGFEARLLYEGDAGIWTVGAHDVLAPYAGPEVIGLDDDGRCIVLVRNSGKTHASVALTDGTWLGGLAHGDVDPRRGGAELYVGSKRGNLYQVVAHPQGGFDSLVIDYFPGAEVHSLAVADLGAGAPELCVGLSTGELWALRPVDAGAGWSRRALHGDPGRVRQMLAVEIDGRPALAYVSRAGRMVLLLVDGDGLREQVLHESQEGLARLAAAPGTGGAPVFWVVGDLGQLLRLERGAAGTWETQTVHLGPFGARGVAVGRLAADPDRESVAVFGYSGDVVLVERDEQGGWNATPVFHDRDKGHWLAAAELDERNRCDELILSGYSGRVVLLTRTP